MTGHDGGLEHWSTTLILLSHSSCIAPRPLTTVFEFDKEEFLYGFIDISYIAREFPKFRDFFHGSLKINYPTRVNSINKYLKHDLYERKTPT